MLDFRSELAAHLILNYKHPRLEIVDALFPYRKCLLLYDLCYFHQ